VAGSDPIVVPLLSKRQRQAMTLQKLNHAIPAIGLLFAGLTAIREGHEGLGFYLGIFEIVSSAALIVLFLRDLRSAIKAPEHHHHGVDWVDIAAAFVLAAEALEHWHVTHHIQRPTVLAAISTLALGLYHDRITRYAADRRALRVTDTGLAVSGRLLRARKIHATWEELASIEIGPRWAAITTRAGRVRRIDLNDVQQEPRIRAALAEAQQRLSQSLTGDQEVMRLGGTPAS
jgi:hypothetical protein